MSNSPDNLTGQIRQFRSVLWLQRWVSSAGLKAIILGSFTISLVAFGGWFLRSWFAVSSSLADICLLVSVIACIVFLIAVGLFSYASYYLLTTTDNVSDKDGLRITYPAAAVLDALLTAQSAWIGLTATEFGRRLLVRTGLSIASIPTDANTDLDADELIMSLEERLKESVITVSTIADVLLADESFRSWLFARGVTENEFRMAGEWVTRSNQRWCYNKRFWSQDRLAEITRISQDLAYGQTPTLDRFTTSHLSQVFITDSATEVFADEVAAIFDTLSRPRNANVLLVGSDISGTNDVIQIIANRLSVGKVPDWLVDYRLHRLDVERVVTAAHSRQEFINLLHELLTEATNAGNVVLAISNLRQLLAVGKRFDIDVFSLLEPYFSHQNLPIVAAVKPRDYHQDLVDSPLAQWTGTVSLHDVDDQALMMLLEDTAESVSGKSVCTVGALQAVAEAGREVITDDEMPHASVDLLLEILAASNREIITKDYVQEYVSDKTGIPVGQVSDEESEKLTHLEEQLHEQIIGQDNAVSAVADALRRNRAGMEDDHKPIGSFLFLGPTGVGKTETAKAVARVYFEQDTVAARIDMSEFAEPQAVTQLIGDTNTAGRLATLVRENPYGVLLLDEFEKADSQVHDLFLQILDEGRFTDGRGRSIRLHNIVIIATSNAGAEHIFDLLSSGENPADNQRAIIESLIEQGIYRPELINRFDAAVVFRPLTTNQLTQVTKKFLSQLTEQVKDRDIQLQIGGGVPEFVADHGFDRRFGARAIHRFVQDTVENIVADKIISKQAGRGDTIVLTVSDIKKEINS